MSLTFYNRRPFWDFDFENDALAWPSDNVFSLAPWRQENSLMNKTKNMVAPLEGILKVDVITNEDNYEIHAGNAIILFISFSVLFGININICCCCC